MTGRIIAISKPVVGKSDLTVWRNGDFFAKLEPEEKVLADRGYQGERSLTTPFKRKPGGQLTDFEKETNNLISCLRILVERVIGRLKNFACLAHAWRGDLDWHEECFNVISNLVNVMLESHPMNWEIPEVLKIDYDVHRALVQEFLLTASQ